MLEFIVLGQVPGTGFVITFSWFIAIAAVAIGYSTLRYQHRHHLVEQQTNFDEISL